MTTRKNSRELLPENTVPTPSSNLLALMLAGLAMLGPFSIDTYLPAFPDIQKSLVACWLAFWF